MLSTEKDLRTLEVFTKKETDSMTAEEMHAAIRMECDIFSMLAALVTYINNVNLMTAPTKGFKQ